MKLFLSILFLSLTAPAFAFAQTNVSTNIVVITNTVDAITVTNAAQAAAAVLHFSAPSVSYENAVEIIGSLLGLVLVGARYLRKVIPDKWQVNGLGLALAHVAGELNPTITKLAQAASDPTATPPGKNTVPTQY